MKKLLLLFSLLTFCAFQAQGWGRLGHATIAEIAQRHLTPAARANIEKYTHGTPLAEYASWMDEVVATPPYKESLAGWHASICTPDCRSPLYIRRLRRGCKDTVSGLDMMREMLKDYREMPDSMVLEAIMCIVHMVGDFHCPAHVRFTDEVNELKYPVVFFGKEVLLHHVWDTGLIQRASGLTYPDYKEFADRLDTWTRRQQRRVARGWAREWFEDCARDVRPYIRTIPEGAELGQEFVDKHIALAVLELRKAAYQLAKALNTIFG